MSVETETVEVTVNSEHISGMLTVREVARIFHVHPNTLRRWSNEGRITACRINPRGDRRFDRSEITRFLAELDSQLENWRKSEEGRSFPIGRRIYDSGTSVRERGFYERR
jgi:excisionase family DNA binding protein